MIVCGIGMVFGSSMDTTICQTAARSIVAALDDLQPVNPPFPHRHIDYRCVKRPSRCATVNAASLPYSP